MSRQSADSTQDALGLVEYTELLQHRPAIVVDFLTRQTMVSLERIHTAKREQDSAPCCRKTSPATEVRTANDDFNQNSVVRYMPALYLDL